VTLTLHFDLLHLCSYFTHYSDPTVTSNPFISNTALTHSDRAAFCPQNFGGTLPKKSPHGLCHRPWKVDLNAERDVPYPPRVFNPDGTFRYERSSDQSQDQPQAGRDSNSNPTSNGAFNQSSNLLITQPSARTTDQKEESKGLFVLTGPKATNYVTTYSAAYQGWASAYKNATTLRESRKYMLRNPNYARLYSNEFATPDTTATRYCSISRSDFLNPLAVIEAGIVKEADTMAQNRATLLREARQRRARVVGASGLLLTGSNSLAQTKAEGDTADASAQQTQASKHLVTSNSESVRDEAEIALNAMNLNRPNTVLEAVAYTKQRAERKVLSYEEPPKNAEEEQAAKSLDPAALAISTSARLWLGPDPKYDAYAGGRIHAYPGALPGYSGYLPRHTLSSEPIAKETPSEDTLPSIGGIKTVPPELDKSAAAVAARRMGLSVYPGSGTGLAPQGAKLSQGLIPGGVRVGGVANSFVSTSALAAQSIPALRSASAAGESDAKDGKIVITTPKPTGAIDYDAIVPGYTGHVPSTHINLHRAQCFKGTEADPHNLKGYINSVTNASASNIGFSYSKRC